MDINVNDAKIRTASVTVKSLTLNDRQVTLSVFRQFPQRCVLNEKLEEVGPVWGKVNYRFGECVHRGEQHLHVVWQSGDILFRDCVENTPYGAEHRLCSDTTPMYGGYLPQVVSSIEIEKLERSMAIRLTREQKTGKIIAIDGHRTKVEWTLGSLGLTIWQNKDHGDEVGKSKYCDDNYLPPDFGGWNIDGVGFADLSNEEVVLAIGQLKVDHAKISRLRADMVENWQKAYRGLAMSQQLFIAV